MVRYALRLLDSYALVLALLVVDYLAFAAWGGAPWGSVVVVLLIGTTLLLAIQISRAGQIWILLAGLCFSAGALAAVTNALVGSANVNGTAFKVVYYLAGGALLLIAALAILNRIGRYVVVRLDPLLGALCVYMMFSICFAFVFSGVAPLTPQGFFVGHAQASSNEYLFFSFGMLTTTGGGDLAPAGGVGRTLASIEMLLGVCYVALVVARLAALWVAGKRPGGRTPAAR
jgi:hypothetical protein